ISTVDVENVLRTELRRAIDPKVPDGGAEGRVMRALADVASDSGLPQRQHSWARRNFGAVLVAAVVVLVVGGALGIGLGLRNRVTTGGAQPGAAGHPPVSSPASPSPPATSCSKTAVPQRAPWRAICRCRALSTGNRCTSMSRTPGKALSSTTTTAI